MSYITLHKSGLNFEEENKDPARTLCDQHSDLTALEDFGENTEVTLQKLGCHGSGALQDLSYFTSLMVKLINYGALTGAGAKDWEITSLYHSCPRRAFHHSFTNAQIRLRELSSAFLQTQLTAAWLEQQQI